MKTVTQKLKKFANKIRFLFPSKLPQGMSEFEPWADSIIETYDLPTSDRDSILFVLATLIMHLGPTADRKPKHYFAVSIGAGAAKQVASGQFQAIKARQEEARKAAAAKAAAEKALEEAKQSLADRLESAANGDQAREA